jgi:hypothetical protein
VHEHNLRTGTNMNLPMYTTSKECSRLYCMHSMSTVDQVANHKHDPWEDSEKEKANLTARI